MPNSARVQIITLNVTHIDTLFVYTVSVWLFSNAHVLIAHEGQCVDYSRPPHPASHFLWE